MEYKSAQDFFAAMLTVLRNECGLPVSESSEPALRLYALAAQLEALLHEIRFIGKQTFPQTADGEYLDRHAELRGIMRLPAEYASGIMRFFADGTSNVTVPKGTVCVTQSLLRYVTTSEVTIPAGVGYADVGAVAEESGAAYNQTAGAINVMAFAPAGVSGCVNPAAFAGGGDAESDDALRTRVLHSFKTLPGGANASYYEAEAMTVDGVRAARAIPRPRGRGSVDVCVASAAGVPDTTLLGAVFALLEKKREIAVDVGVVPPRTAAVNVTATITPAAGYDGGTVAASCKTAVISMFDGSLLARPLYASKILAALLEVEGVENARLLSPAADVAAEADLLPILGTLEVTAV